MLFHVGVGHFRKLRFGNMQYIAYFWSFKFLGFEAQLGQIELDKQDTGSWYWNYKIEGSHIKLEYVEL